jgi:hypothetical protein
MSVCEDSRATRIYVSSVLQGQGTCPWRKAKATLQPRVRPPARPPNQDETIPERTTQLLTHVHFRTREHIT